MNSSIAISAYNDALAEDRNERSGNCPVISEVIRAFCIQGAQGSEDILIECELGGWPSRRSNEARPSLAEVHGPKDLPSLARIRGGGNISLVPSELCARHPLISQKNSLVTMLRVIFDVNGENRQILLLQAHCHVRLRDE